jgi:RND family efflux transporter MFP subunit
MKTTTLLFLPALLLLSGCEPLEQARTALQAVINDKSGPAGDHGHPHDQGGDHGHGHDHQGHGPADLQPVRVTHFSPVTELHVEFKPLVVGEASSFAVHLSRLDDGGPVSAGRVTVSLVGGGAPPEHFSVTAPDTPGIFRPLVTPREAAWRQVVVSLTGEQFSTSHHLGEFGAFPSRAAALAETPHEEPVHDAISYTKEQQWQVDFNTVKVEERTLRASILATGLLRPKADGEVYLSATSAGHVHAHAQGRFPYPGMRVEQGDMLATIAPQLAADSDLSTLNAAVEKARSSYDLAKHERERLEQLWRDKVIALHRLHEAETTLQLAKTELEAAERRYRQSTGQQQAAGSGIPILAPIEGVIADSHTAAGKYVTEGEALFHIVNLQRLWLEARIAEADIGALQDPDGAWFTVNGFDRTFDTFGLDGRKVAFGGIIDPVSRTAPLIFEFDNPDQRLRAGMFANVRVFTGETASGPVVPASAIYDDGGQEVVYVMLDGEHFLRRPVRLGLREGDWVQLLSGVTAGERVVSEGAYLVRLASASPAEAGHGHAH